LPEKKVTGRRSAKKANGRRSVGRRSARCFISCFNPFLRSYFFL